MSDHDNNNNNDSKRGLLIDLTREFLQKRRGDIIEDPSLLETDPLTLSTIWYRLRPKLLKRGIVFQKSTRRTVEYDYVRAICEDELGVKRAALGIHAAVRAQT